jgi:ferritin-like metal-binding protein YciE
MSLNEFSFNSESKCLKILKESLEAVIYCKIDANFDKQLTIIDEQISRLKESLVIHKEQFMPIKKDIFIFERSAWQTFNTFIANCSKFFIGNAIHCNIYGYGDGVEEIRREIDNMSSDEVELMLATIFDEANEIF